MEAALLSDRDSEGYWAAFFEAALEHEAPSCDHPLFAGHLVASEVEHVHRVAEGVSSKVARIANGSDAREYALICAGVALLMSAYLDDRERSYWCTRWERDAGLVFFSVSLQGAASFKDIVLRTHQAIERTRQHEHAPVSSYLRDHPRKESLRATLTRVAVLRGAPAEAGDCVALAFGFERDSAHSLVLRVRKPTAKGDARSLELVSKQLEKLLARLCDDPAADPFGENVATDDDRALQLGPFNPGLGPRPEGLLHREFERCAARHAARPAVLDAEEVLSYAELERCANAFARTLVNAGVQPGERVGVMLDRSADLVVALFAILKAGAVYVPLDARAPRARLEAIARSAELRVVVTMQTPGQTRPPFPTICIERARLREPSAGTVERISVDPGPDAVAYVIYTSGSTGQPKGVVLRHADVLATLAALQKAYPVLSDDVYLFKSSQFFDVSMAELFGFFWEGGALAVLRSREELDMPRLLSAIETYGVTHVNFVPSLYDTFVSYLRAEHAPALASLKYVMLAGESPRAASVSRFHALGLRAQQINLYGATENAIYCSGYTIPASHEPSIPMGRPLPGFQLFVLDERRELQAIGVPGELYVSGHGVAAGYLNDAERTAEAFLPCPYGAGHRMYKTGDRCFFGSDGNLRFVGRFDSQVKLRGYRVELGEIEHAILGEERVKDCVVVAKHDDAGKAHSLVAFVTLEESESESEIGAALEARLATLLPEYMIPRRFVTLERLPRTASGKIDRSGLARLELPKLPALEVGRGVATLEIGSEATAILATLRDVLRDPALGIDDDLFLAGATSLQAVAIGAELSERFAIRAVDVFTLRTARALGDAARGRTRSNATTQLVSRLLASETPSAAVPRAPIVATHVARTPRPLGSVLLTGATGYFGAYLLRELLDAGARVDTLVRAASRAHAMDRVRRTLEYYFPARTWPSERLTALAGDLTDPSPSYSDLDVGRYDTVIHAAADVRLFGDYDTLHAINVAATERLLKAFRGRKAVFHHVSTVSVHEGVAEGRLTEETIALEEPDNPYVRTKVAAERVVRQHGDSGATRIHRVGNLVLGGDTGHLQRNVADNAFCQQLRALWDLGVLPVTFTGSVEMTPVDAAARALVLLAGGDVEGPQTFHLYHPRPVAVAAIVDAFNRHGAGIRRTRTREELHLALNRRFASLDRSRQEQILLFGALLEGRRELDSRLTVARLEHAGFEWQPLGASVLDRIIEQLSNAELLQPERNEGAA